MLPLALTGLLALSACQLADDDDPADKAHRLNSMKSFPLHDYIPDPSSDGAKAILKAQWILTKPCMVKLGFPGFATLDVKAVESTYPVRQGALAGGGRSGEDDFYGVDDPERAAEHGYHDRHDEDTGEAGTSQPQEYPAAQYAALTGSFSRRQPLRARTRHPGGRLHGGGDAQDLRPRAQGDEGQRRQAQRVLLPRLPAVVRVPQGGAQGARLEEGRPRVVVLHEGEGLPLPEPGRGVHGHRLAPDREAVGQGEEDGGRDARCKLDTGYIDTVHGIDSRVQKASIAQHKKALDDLQAAYDRSVGKARKIIADAS